MSGSILGVDQVRKINERYVELVAHIKTLLEADHTGFGLMQVHSQVESFNSDEMARIFRDLSFISPREKLALVRAAIYELMAREPMLFVAPETYTTVEYTPSETRMVIPDVPAAKEYSPPQFRLNVNRAANIHGQKPADTPPPTPVVTSTHTPIVQPKVQKTGE